MTVVPINPSVGGAAALGSGPSAAFARVAGQIVRLDQRLRAVEAASGQLGANAVTGGQIGPNQIDGTHIAPSSITTAHITAGSIDATVINAVSVAAAVGDFISINADQIVAGDIAADQMTTNWLLAGQASISTLSAITSNMGAITAGNITGATIRTGATGARVVMDSGGLRGYALDGITKTFEIDNGTGIASFTGVANLDASSVIPGDAVLSGTLPGDAIVNGTITGIKIAAGTIEANNIKAGSITASSIGLEVGSNNVLYNSSFEDTTAVAGSIPRWHVINDSVTDIDIYDDVPGVAVFGGRAAKVICTGASPSYIGIGSDSVTVLEQKSYTASAYIYAPTATTSGLDYDIIIDWFDANGTSIQQDMHTAALDTAGAALTVPFTVPGTVGGSAAATWSRLDTTVTAPSGARSAAVYVLGRDVPPGEYFLLDGVQFESGNSVSGYSPRADEILTYQVGPTQIAPDSITTDKILTGSITAADITVANLQALSADMGSLVAGTVTGATVQSAASGNRAVLNAAGFSYLIGASGTTIGGRSYNPNETVFRADSSGVFMRGSIIAESMDFVSIGTSPGAAPNTIRWYSGNYSALISRTTVYSNGSYGYRQEYLRSNAPGQVAEWSARAERYDGAENASLILQCADGGLDSLRFFWTGTTKWQIDENGDMYASRNISSGGSINAGSSMYAPGGLTWGGVANWNGTDNLWLTANTYFRMHPAWGMMHDAGNYTTIVYGGAGTAHVIYAYSGQDGGGTSFQLGCSYGTTHYNLSDSKAKHSITDVPEDHALSKVRALRPRRYTLKGGPGTGKSMQGFLAEEVADIFPMAVDRTVHPETKEETLYLDQTAIVSALVAAVQELSETVNILRGEAPDAPLTRSNVTPLKA